MTHDAGPKEQAIDENFCSLLDDCYFCYPVYNLPLPFCHALQIGSLLTVQFSVRLACHTSYKEN
jgi:hypothetical protein